MGSKDKKSQGLKKQDRGSPGRSRRKKGGKSASPDHPPDRAKAASETAPKPPNTLMIFMLILFFSAILGMLSVLQFRESPFFELPIIDEEAYVSWGEEISSGDVAGDAIFYQDPLYPYFLGLLFSLFGKSYLMVRMVQVILGTASVAVVFWIGRKLLGDKPALLAAGVMAGYRGLYFFEILLLKATMVTFLSAVSCAIGVAAVEKPRARWRWIMLGASLGLLVLLRGNFLALIPFVFLWAFFYDRKAELSKKLGRAVLYGVGLGMVLAPVTLRNYTVGGELVLTTSQGGANFFIGNNERANGRYVTLPYVRANPKWESMDFKAEAEKRAGRELSPSEVSSFWFKESFKWINAHPDKWFRLQLHKARLMIHQHEVPDNHSFYLTRNLFVSVLWLPFLGFGLLWGPALVGMWALARKDPRATYPALFAVLYTASIIPFFIVARYRVAVVPAMAVFSAASIFWAYERWRSQDMAPLSAAGVLVFISLIIGFGPTTESRAPMGVEYYLLGNAYLKTDRPGESIQWYDKALEAQPDHKDAAKNRTEALRRTSTDELSLLMAEVAKEETGAADLVEIAKRLEQLGQMAMAVGVYEKVVKKDPEFFTPYARLGFLYATRPEIQNPEKAIFFLKKGLEIKPDSLDTINALGNVYFLSGDTVEARRSWETILFKDPGHSGAKQNLEMLEEGPKR
jgi:4-amino-4-deoxy-L-arabinose transferase-like glycosyltransferase